MEPIVTIEEIIIDLPTGTLATIPVGTRGEILSEQYHPGSGQEYEVLFEGHSRTEWVYGCEVRSV